MPRAADHVAHYLAPLVPAGVVFLSYAVLPVGRNMTAVNLDAGVLDFFAAGAATELAVFTAGWSSRTSKYSLLGATRAIAQMVSYEIPLILSSVAVIMIAGTLSTVKIVEQQARTSHGLAHWYVFTPWGLAGFILFMIAKTAETNRSPFDLPEGESEIIAGYFIEYSGFKFALFFLAEYLEMFAVSGLGITLFLGGWSSPIQFSGVDSVVDVVLREAAGADLGVHLDSRHSAAAAHGSADEFCLEIHAADESDRHSFSRHLALSHLLRGASNTRLSQ